MCTSSHGSSAVEVRRVEVTGVALKLDGEVSEGNCGSTEDRRVTSGMIVGVVPSMDTLMQL